MSKREALELVLYITFLIAIGTGIGVAKGISFLPAFGIAWLSFLALLGIEALMLKRNKKPKKEASNPP